MAKKMKKIAEIKTGQPPFPQEVYCQRYSEGGDDVTTGENGHWRYYEDAESAYDEDEDVGERKATGVVAVYKLDRLVRINVNTCVRETTLAVP